MNLMCFVGTKSTFKVPIPEIHTQIITNPIATKNPLVETNRKPTGNQQENHGKLFRNFTFFFRRWRMDVWPSIVKSNWIPWRPPPRSPPFFGVEGENPREDPKKEIWNERSYIHHTFFEFQMIIVYDLSKHISVCSLMSRYMFIH